jgi:hypothetical protein
MNAKGACTNTAENVSIALGDVVLAECNRLVVHFASKIISD